MVIWGKDCAVKVVAGKMVKSVTSPTGEESVLFKDILEEVKKMPEKELESVKGRYKSYEGKYIDDVDNKTQLALGLYATTTSKNFKEAYKGGFDKNGEAKFEEAKGYLIPEYGKKGTDTMHQLPSGEAKNTTPSKASDVTVAKCEEFVKRMGFDWKKLTDALYDKDGNKITQGASVDFFHKLVETVEGADKTQLPEESMHIAVRLIKEKDPQLFKEMMSRINKYALYDDINAQYSKHPDYQIDGKPNIPKIKEEAIGKILVEHIIKSEDGATEKPELLQQTQTWWDKIKTFLKNVMGKQEWNPFKEAAEQFNRQKGTFSADMDTKVNLMDKMHQLSSEESQKADEELDEHLLNYLSNWHVKSEMVDDMKKRFGIDSLGVADVINKMIYFSKNKKLDTIAEESSHIITMLMGKNNEHIKAMLENIEKSSVYKSVYDEYMPVYNNIEQVKKEAVDKAVSEAIVNGWKTKVKENAGFWQKLIDKVKAFYEEYFVKNTPYLQRQANKKVNNAASFIANSVLKMDKNIIGEKNTGKELLDFEKALQHNDHAKNIIDIFTKKFGYSLTGSLSIAGQGEDIYRPTYVPIHDIDFLASKDFDLKKMDQYMAGINAIPTHGGIFRKDGSKDLGYGTYAYMVPKKGYYVEALERHDWGGKMLKDIILKNEKGETIYKGPWESSPADKVLNVDFFYHPSDIRKKEKEGFASWQDVYFGKLQLGANDQNNRWFEREKDVNDYKESNPKDRSYMRPEFMYYQLPQEEKQEELFKKITETGAKIEKPNDNEDKYKVSGVPVPIRVHDIIEHSRKEFKKHYKGKEEQEATDAHVKKAQEFGTDFAADMVQILDSLIDKQTGLLRERPIEDAAYIPLTNKYQSAENREKYGDIYENAKKFITGWQERNDADPMNPIIYKGILDLYPRGTRFIYEVPIYDPEKKFKGNTGLVGTPDFMAITPDGVLHIHDWKTIGNSYGIADYNKHDYNNQMKEYKSILENAYGGKVETARMDLIHAKWDKDDNIAGINVFGGNFHSPTGDKFRPFLTEHHKTGDQAIDDFAEKLIGVLNAMNLSGTTQEEREYRMEKAKKLETAILRLRAEKTFDPIMEQGLDFLENAKKEYEVSNANVQKKDYANMSDEDFNKEVSNLSSMKENLFIYKNLEQFATKKYIPNQELQDKLLKLSKEAKTLYEKHVKLDMEIASKWSEGKTIGDLASAQIAAGKIAGMARERSNQDLFSVQALQEVLQNVNNVVENRINDVRDELTNDLGNGIFDEAKKWGNLKKLMDMIKSKKGNRLVNDVKPEFYQELEKAKENDDTDWALKNVDGVKLKEFLDKKRENGLKAIFENNKLGDKGLDLNKPEEWADHFNKEGMPVFASFLEKKVENLKHFTTITNHSNYLLYGNRFPIKERNGLHSEWISDEYKELSKPENLPAKKVYDFIQKWNASFRESGYYESENSKNKLPFVSKALLSHFLEGEFQIKKTALDLISNQVSEESIELRDPRTGELVNTLPKYFQTEIAEKDQSEDLFKNMFLHILKGIEWEEKSKVEDVVRFIRDVEKMKGIRETTSEGRVTGKIVTGTQEAEHENVKLYDDFVKAGFYGIRDLSSNKSKGFGKSFEGTDGEQRKLSGEQALNSVSTAAALSLLSWKPTLMFFRLLETNLEGLYSAGKYYNTKEMMESLWDFTASRTPLGDSKKTIGFIKDFLPVEENMHIQAKKLSMDKIDDLSVQEMLMRGVKGVHNVVVYSSFLSHIKNAIVINGTLQNARDYYRNTAEYRKIYDASTSPEERRKIENGLENKVKELIEKHGLINKASYDEKTGKMVYDGLDMNDKSVARFKQLVKVTGRELSGNISTEDQSRMRSYVWWRQMLMYNNWLPRQWDLRVGELHYNKGKDAYEWGRTRVFVKTVLAEGFMPSLGKTLKLMLGTDDISKLNDKGINTLQEAYLSKRQEFREKTGQELNMTKEEFFDLYREKLKMQVREFRTMLIVSAFTFGILATLPKKGDKDYEETKGKFAILKKTMLKLRDAVDSYYSPDAFAKFGNSTKFPVVGYLIDAGKAVGETLEDFWGITADAAGFDEYGNHIIDKNHLIRDWSGLLPVGGMEKEILPMVDPKMAKYLGIKAFSGDQIGK